CQCDVKIPKTPPPKSGEQVTSKKRNWDGVIVLSGRTTEIHPAIARYVVPHEYGHILEDCLGQIRYPHDSHNCGAQVVKEWAKVRRLPQELFSQRYSPTTHHLMPTEVFANDFRHALGFETEWWPHEDVCRPLGKRGTVKAVRWWNDALDQLKDCHREAQNALH
ncbi:MAG: hypothetical protein KGL39_37745, partial [Patescibacteria group bacterium]|nr:hypothetical protein [Patescibacteria group bacterium]